ncbi:hypothetical protein G6F43_006639 [Rhizopus delemar]|nr:hypothetical protein G6F43_006639 [Rhizopus delemar]
MERLVKYSQSAKQLYKSYPLVMVFCIDKLSPSTFSTKFTPVDAKPCMQRILCCDFWTKNCYLVSKASLACEEVDANISSLRALLMFLVEQSSTLYGHSRPEHATVRELYRLAMECTASKDKERDDLVHIVDMICTNNEKLWRKVNASLDNIPGTLKAKNIVSRALEFNSSAKRKYSDIEGSDNSLEPLPGCSHKKTTAEDSGIHHQLPQESNRQDELGALFAIGA